MSRTLMLMTTVIMIGIGLKIAVAQPYSDIFVFGDSLSDTGNRLIATEGNTPVSPPYFMGRFTNGPVWVEGLAERFGLQVAPSLASGTNFAFGGAEIAQGVEESFEAEVDVFIPSLQLQVLNFLASDFIDNPFGGADANALYIVWGGPNDLRKAVMAGTTDPNAEAQRVVNNLAAAIRRLADAGAKIFLVPNLPNLSHTPESRALGPEVMALVMDLSIRFNTALKIALDTIEVESDVTIFRLDVFTLLEEAVTNPAAFGFTNVTDPCLTGGPFTGGIPCATPEGHLFWDAIHPTTAAHAILADHAFMITAPMTVLPGNANLQ
jgi:phospholipase/lecithinase/hemolysin